MRALRSIPVLVVLSLAAVLTPVVPVAAAPSGPAPSSSLSWKGCGGGFQCATLVVPVDTRSDDDVGAAGDRCEMGRWDAPLDVAAGQLEANAAIERDPTTERDRPRLRHDPSCRRTGRPSPLSRDHGRDARASPRPASSQPSVPAGRRTTDRRQPVENRRPHDRVHRTLRTLARALARATTPENDRVGSRSCVRTHPKSTEDPRQLRSASRASRGMTVPSTRMALLSL